MSARAIWNEMVRLRRAGQADVTVEQLRRIHYLAPSRLARMARQGEVERIGRGLYRIADHALPADLRRPT